MTNPDKKNPLGISISRRLAAFTCILLLFVVATYSLSSYFGVRKASLLIGTERLQALTRQLNTLLSQSNTTLLSATTAIAREPRIVAYVQNPNTTDTAALAQLNKLSKDTTSIFIGLYSADRKLLLHSGNAAEPAIDITSDWQRLVVHKDSTIIGRLYELGGVIYYPVIATVHAAGTKAFLIRWRKVFANPKSLAQLTDLMGLGAQLYFGNKDGSVWTDMIHPVAAPPVDSISIRSGKTIEFARSDGQQQVAAVQQMSNSPWVVLVAFSKNKMTEAATRFLFWDILIGLVLITIGIIAAWLMSRGITKPLRKLTDATKAIAAGNYSLQVEVTRNDEVGELGRSFNRMITEVQNMQAELEKKVAERTVELQLANNELEAFSYSVSHDLRAPLRAISGYSGILQEDYKDKLDEEAVRLISVIVRNTKTMGQLIDDLIAFSMLGRKTISHHPVNMQALANDCVREVLEQTRNTSCHITVDELPSCLGDQNLLKQTWINLISNGVKYSSRKEDAEVHIYSKQTPTHFIYVVRDNGVGFDMEYSAKLFNVFQRLHSQAEFEGTGIGLALVRRIIGKHHGEVWAEAVPGEGASFFFSIPKELS